MNITFAFDDEHIAAVKTVAANHGTSVTGLVRASVKPLVAVDKEISSMNAFGGMQDSIDCSYFRSIRR
jgi:hypothetical protein